MPNDDEGVGVKREMKAELIKTQNQNCNFDKLYDSAVFKMTS